jgi:clan AA aspartic protease
VIVGNVSAALEPTIRLTLLPAGGVPIDVDFIVDTGFSGFLSLPAAFVNGLGFPYLMREGAVLADGSTRMFDIHAVTVLWDGRVRTVETDLADGFNLVGTYMLAGHDLSIRMTPGGTVTIEASP